LSAKCRTKNGVAGCASWGARRRRCWRCCRPPRATTDQIRHDQIPGRDGTQTVETGLTRVNQGGRAACASRLYLRDHILARLGKFLCADGNQGGGAACASRSRLTYNLGEVDL
jgi:hypothetical protein